jgi:RHS repeat-associated protein
MDSMAIRHYSEEYAYDRSGNILSMHHVSDGNIWKREYEYAEDSNRLLATRIGDYSYSYEYHPTAGFMVRMPHLADIGWNFLEQVESSTRQVRTDGGVPEMTYYQYDGSGKRIRKTTVCASDKGDGILKDERIYIGGYEVYRRHSGSNKGLERVTLSLMDGDSRLVVIERRNDVDDGTAKRLERYQFTNMVGSSVLEVDDRCRVITKEEFTPFGSTSYQARNKAVKAAAKRYRFTGMERDEETGLSYHSARYYIPWLGRWLSADPIGIEGGLNLYCYCGNDPVNKSDVEGTDVFDRALAVFQFAGGACEIVGGILFAVGTGVTGAGIAVGIVVAAHGFDQVVAGTRTIISGKATDTGVKTGVKWITYQFSENETASSVVGDVVDTAVSIAMPNPFKLAEHVKKGATVGKAVMNELNIVKSIKESSKARRLADNTKGMYNKVKGFFSKPKASITSSVPEPVKPSVVPPKTEPITSSTSLETIPSVEPSPKRYYSSTNIKALQRKLRQQRKIKETNKRDGIISKENDDRIAELEYRISVLKSNKFSKYTLRSQVPPNDVPQVIDKPKLEPSVVLPDDAIPHDVPQVADNPKPGKQINDILRNYASDVIDGSAYITISQLFRSCLSY